MFPLRFYLSSMHRTGVTYQRLAFGKRHLHHYGSHMSYFSDRSCTSHKVKHRNLRSRIARLLNEHYTASLLNEHYTANERLFQTSANLLDYERREITDEEKEAHKPFHDSNQEKALNEDNHIRNITQNNTLKGSNGNTKNASFKTNLKTNNLPPYPVHHTSVNYKNNSQFQGERTHSEDISVERWGDTFGTLTSKKNENLFEDDLIEGEEEVEPKPHLRLDKYNRRHPPYWYGRKVQMLGEKGKVREAIQVYEEQMLKEDRVLPNNFVLSSLLAILGKAGYTKKAFQVYNQYKKMGLIPNDYIYSSLFEACANSPWKEDGLKRATELLEEIGVKEFKPNSVVYNSIIRAFACCGDSKTSFLLADKVASVEKISSITFSHILMAAISDKDVGFWYAVQIWRWMVIKRISPEIYHYQLLLEALTKCGVGNQVLAEHLITPINPATTLRYYKKGVPLDEGRKLIGKYEDDQNSPSSIVTGTGIENENVLETERTTDTAGTVNREENNIDNSVETSVMTQKNVSPKVLDGNSVETSVMDQEILLPNVLDISQNMSNILSLNEIKTPKDRLAMVGGMVGFFKDMQKNGVKPNLKIFDMMFYAIDTIDEPKMLSLMEYYGVEPDIDLLGKMMIRRGRLGDEEGLKEFFALIEKKGFVPNMKIYNALAFTCTKTNEGINLIQKIKESKISPDIRIYTTLIGKSGINFRYKMLLLNKLKEEDLKPDRRLLTIIESQLNMTRKLILGEEKKNSNDERLKKLDKNYNQFIQFYKSWLKKMDIKPPDDPWASFRNKDKQ